MYTRLLFILTLISFLFGCQNEESNGETNPSHPDIIQAYSPPVFDSLHLSEALTFCAKNNLATDFAILINLSHHSGNYRLFGMNLETGDTIIKGLVAHGHCKGPDGRIAKFSNDVGSNCSSLGKYRVGSKYTGEWGVSFKLQGLETSNDNAEKRYVVLHAHECIPEEPREDDICLSEGCPTVSPNVFKQLQTLIYNNQKHVLLWIFSESSDTSPEQINQADLQRRYFEEWKSEK